MHSLGERQKTGIFRGHVPIRGGGSPLPLNNIQHALKNIFY